MDVSDAVLRAIVERFAGQVQTLPSPFDVPVVKVRPGALPEVAALLRSQGFSMLLDIGGVDYLGSAGAVGARFEVVYHFLDPVGRRRVRLRVPVEGEPPEVPSLCGLWPAANWAEREVFDLFGIRFTGHPGLRRILLPDDWEGHPLRKDYPLRGPRQAGQPQAQRSRFFPLRAEGDGGAEAPGGTGATGAAGAAGTAPQGEAG